MRAAGSNSRAAAAEGGSRAAWQQSSSGAHTSAELMLGSTAQQGSTYSTAANLNVNMRRRHAAPVGRRCMAQGLVGARTTRFNAWRRAILISCRSIAKLHCHHCHCHFTGHCHGISLPLPLPLPMTMHCWQPQTPRTAASITLRRRPASLRGWRFGQCLAAPSRLMTWRCGLQLAAPNTGLHWRPTDSSMGYLRGSSTQ